MTKALIKTDFNSAYKTIRNRFRKYQQDSCIRTILASLNRKFPSKLDELREMPWQQLLLLKWICQDSVEGADRRPVITNEDYYQLRQNLHDFPQILDLGTRESFPARLFLRQLLYQQIGFQRRYSKGFCREAALLAQQPPNSILRRLFREKTSLEVEVFLDLSFATYAAILSGEKSIPLSWFEPLKRRYSSDEINSFIKAISLDISELPDYFRELPDCTQHQKYASEYYEFPVIKRFPFLRLTHSLECWHPMVFYRGMEGFVHSVLSEAGATYINNFSKLFEEHIVREAKKLSATVFGEQELAAFVPQGSKVPDALIAFPGCNIFVEAKAGLFDESVMVVGHSEIFAQKTRTLQKALQQGRSASSGLRVENRAIAQVIQAPIDYLLIVTNKELGAGRGTTLSAMYPPEVLDEPEADCFLPLENVYVVSIEDYERLIVAAQHNEVYLPTFMQSCVTDDNDANTSVHYFEQHLDKQRVRLGFSDLVKETIEKNEANLIEALNPITH